MALTAKVAELRRNGEDVISFGAGEPDFDTPSPIKEAAINAINEGCTKYTPTAGTAELRAAISEKLVRENGIETKPEQIVVSCGAKHSVFNALMAICNPGDEVILIAPFWMTYRDQISLAGGVTKILQTTVEDGYIPKIEQLESLITPKTKAIVINSPCNPTGAVYPLVTLRDISETAAKHDIYVISDEIYEKHVYGDAKHFSIATLGNADKTITISGVSKSFAMTGWRIGYAAANTEMAKAMTTLQDQVTSNASSISQKAALEALKMPRSVVDDMVVEFDCRRKLILEELSKISGVRCATPSGAFYAFVDVSAKLGGSVKSDMELAQYLLEGHKVASVPGSVFEGAGHLRLTYALGRDEITEGVRRIAEGLQSLT